MFDKKIKQKRVCGEKNNPHTKIHHNLPMNNFGIFVLKRPEFLHSEVHSIIQDEGDNRRYHIPDMDKLSEGIERNVIR